MMTSSPPFSPDTNYEHFNAPKYIDFANPPPDKSLEAFFDTMKPSSPTFLKAPVLFRPTEDTAPSPYRSSIVDNDDLQSAASGDDTSVVDATVALAEQFVDASDNGSELAAEDAIHNDDNADDNESMDSVATEVINFAMAPVAAIVPATPQTTQTAQMLKHCDAAEDDLTQRIHALEHQIRQLRSSAPVAATVVHAEPAAVSQTPRSAYLDAVNRVKMNIGMMAQKENELHQLQAMQREMHLSSKTPQEKPHRHRSSSAQRSGRRQSAHTAVRVLRNESTFSTPHHNRDATDPVRLMATGPVRVTDQTVTFMTHQHHVQSAVTPHAVPTTAIKRQASQLLTGALRIDTNAAALAATTIEQQETAEREAVEEEQRRPSSAHRRRSHSRPSTPRRPQSHRTPHSPAMYDESAVGLDTERHHRRRHHIPRGDEHETPRSTHRARSHSGHRNSHTPGETSAHRHRHRSHSHHRSSTSHGTHRLRAESAPPTPAMAALGVPLTRKRSMSISVVAPSRDHGVRRQLLTEAREHVQSTNSTTKMPRFMQPTESAAMRVIEQQREHKKPLPTNPRDQWDIAPPKEVTSTISQLDRAAIRQAQVTAAFSPPPLPAPPIAPAPKQQPVQRDWSFSQQPQQQQQQSRPVARSESLTIAASRNAAPKAMPIARSSTMTNHPASRALRSMSTNKSSVRDRILTTEDRELLEMAEARRKLHQHVMSQSVGLPKFVRKSAFSNSK